MRALGAEEDKDNASHRKVAAQLLRHFFENTSCFAAARACISFPCMLRITHSGPVPHCFTRA